MQIHDILFLKAIPLSHNYFWLLFLLVFLEQQKLQKFGPEDILTEDGFIKIMDFSGKDTECFVVGKWSGVSVEYVAKHDRSYITWILNNPGFDKKTKLICESYIA